MAATETRLLLLGTVMIFEPVNGYQLRRELLSWQVDDWAHVNPGSIYSGLATLARQGNLHRHDIVDGTREVAVYTSSPQGRSEFQRLWREAVVSVDLLSPLPFHTAVALMPQVARADVLTALRERLAEVDAKTADQARGRDSMAGSPPHVLAMADLWLAMAETERTWLVDLIGRVERGDLEFAGEASEWAPPADDPGWAMAGERARYVDLIRRS